MFEREDVVGGERKGAGWRNRMGKERKKKERGIEGKKEGVFEKPERGKDGKEGHLRTLRTP